MKRIVLDLQCAMFADAITMALERSDPDFLVLRLRRTRKNGGALQIEPCLRTHHGGDRLHAVAAGGAAAAA